MSTVPLSPSLYFSAGTTVEMDDGTVVDQTDDGQLAKRDLFAGPVFDIGARFTFVDETQQSALQDFFWDNRSADILLTLNGIQYLCKVMGRVRLSFPNGGTLGLLEVSFKGTKVVS